MSALFDVDHWNSFSGQLPVLVQSISDGDCWENTLNYPSRSLSAKSIANNETKKPAEFTSPMASEILGGIPIVAPMRNLTKQLLSGSFTGNLRKMDFLPHVQNCTVPFVYGGGKGAGRLWNDYLSLTQSEPNSSGVNATNLISLVARALLPSSKWRDIAHTCIKSDPRNQATSLNAAPYLALHARVEVDMMLHKCSRDMEKNLTKILSMVDQFLTTHNQRNSQEELERIFIAVSRTGMQLTTSNAVVRNLALENLKTLSARRSHDPGFIECGDEMMDSWYNSQELTPPDYYGSLLPSILNFYLAVESTVFIGVSKSSWSTDVWTTRFYQGKGGSNFQYTKEGIVPISNGGLPEPHRNC